MSLAEAPQVPDPLIIDQPLLNDIELFRRMASALYYWQISPSDDPPQHRAHALDYEQKLREKWAIINARIGEARS